MSNSVSAGAYIAVSECAYQFRFEKWNCPESAFNLNPVGNHISNKGTSPHPPSRISLSLDPFIPQPLARIGSLKLELDDKSAMQLSDYKSLGNKDKSTKAHSIEESHVDTFDILNPPKIFDSPSTNDEDAESANYDSQGSDQQTM